MKEKQETLSQTGRTILVMRDGRVVERGTHRDLIGLGGFNVELIGYARRAATLAVIFLEA